MISKKNISKSLKMQERACTRIPGKTQLLSKRSELFAPGQWPGYYSKARGIETWDLDGNKYVDMSTCGIGANILGFADQEVDSSVLEAIEKGTSCSLNCPEEIELADLLCEIHPWAQMARYTRSGGEAMAVAVRIARAYTKKDIVAFCGYHGWHDWYLAANLGEGDSLDGHLLPGLEPLGVPRGLKGTALPFRYNCIEELERIVGTHGNKLAAIIMEPVREVEPDQGFLERVCELANESGAVIIFDEITSAFRLNTGGAHLLYGVKPDIAVFAKAISNGYPMGAIIGNEKVMQAAQSTFISSTYWTDRIGPTAALATIRKHRRLDVWKHLVSTGKEVQELWRHSANSAGLMVKIFGIAPLSHFSFDYPNRQEMMTLFTQMMLEKGFLASGKFYSSYAHQDSHIMAYQQAVNDIFCNIKKAVENNNVEQQLKGAVAQSGFQRLTR